MRTYPLLVCLSASVACGGGAAPVAPVSAIGRSPTPPPVVPAPTPPAAPTPATAQAPGCAVQPAGGVLVARDRGHAQVMVGRSGAIVVHGTRRRVPGGPIAPGEWDCGYADRASALSFPFSQAREVVDDHPVTSFDCNVERADPVRLIRAGDDPLAVACRFHPSHAWTCGAYRPFAGAGAGAIDRFGFPARWNRRAVISAFGWSGGNLFGVAVADDGRAAGFAGPPGGTISRSIIARGVPTSGGLGIRIVTRAGSDARVTITPLRGDAYQLTMNASGAVVGEVSRVPTSEPTSPSEPTPRSEPFLIEEAREPPPTHLVAGRDPASLSPVSGLGPGATFAPSWRHWRDRPLLVWSEGADARTRIRAARFDPVTRAVLGPVAEVSSAGLEAGSATLDTSGDHAVIAWDEKRDGTWEVRAAELVCP